MSMSGLGTFSTTANATIPSDPQQWIQDHVKGRLAPIDISNIKQESVCTIEEDLSNSEQVRHATYFEHHLTFGSKRAQMKVVGQALRQ